eukprot:1888820-Prymnesium_polylepis.1
MPHVVQTPQTATSKPRCERGRRYQTKSVIHHGGIAHPVPRVSPATRVCGSAAGSADDDGAAAPSMTTVRRHQA